MFDFLFYFIDPFYVELSFFFITANAEDGILPDKFNASQINISIFSQILNLFSGSQILDILFLEYLGIIILNKVDKVNFFWTL